MRLITLMELVNLSKMMIATTSKKKKIKMRRKITREKLLGRMTRESIKTATLSRSVQKCSNRGARIEEQPGLSRMISLT